MPEPVDKRRASPAEFGGSGGGPGSGAGDGRDPAQAPMAPADALRFAELLVARFSHELVGPVGAVTNGLELMESLGAEAGEEASGLVARSAESVKARVQFYRAAYGRAGRDLAGVAELRALCAPFFDVMEGVDLDWPMAPVAPTLEDDAPRLVLNLAALGAEALPRGGRVRLDVDEATLAVTAEGAQAGLPEPLVAALDGRAGIDDLGPRTVHGYLTRQLASACGRRLSIAQEGAERLVIAAPRTAAD